MDNASIMAAANAMLGTDLKGELLRAALEYAASRATWRVARAQLTALGFDLMNEDVCFSKEELDAYILGGLIPIISERNARFMDSEVNGISVSPEIIKQYVGKDRAQSEELAVEITTRIAKEIEPYVDGYYIVTPFNRTSLIERILKELR